MLCCAVLCCLVLCCARSPCCAVLCCAVLRRPVVCCAALCLADLGVTGLPWAGLPRLVSAVHWAFLCAVLCSLSQPVLLLLPVPHLSLPDFTEYAAALIELRCRFADVPKDACFSSAPNTCLNPATAHIASIQLLRLMLVSNVVKCIRHLPSAGSGASPVLTTPLPLRLANGPCAVRHHCQGE